MDNRQPAASWELLAEFLDVGMAGSHEQLLQHMTGALQGLRLQPQQLKRIQTLVSRAVTRAEREGKLAPPAPIQVRIWLMRTCADDCGWGFFVVETNGQGPGNPATVETSRLVQLFLYQERDS